MFKHNSILLSDIVKYVINSKFRDDDFCIYGKDDIPLNLESVYFISDYPEVIDDRDIYPLDVQQKELSLIYYGEQFVDVIYSALEQKASASIEELVQALIYYYQNDEFITFNKLKQLDFIMNKIERELGKKLLIEDIKLFELDHDIKLPSSMTEFYLKYNGGELKNKFKYLYPQRDVGIFPIFYIMPLVSSFYEDIESVEANINFFRNINESYKNYMPIALDLFGNYIVVSLVNGEVYWTDHEDPNEFVLFGNDIFSFINSLSEEEPS